MVFRRFFFRLLISVSILVATSVAFAFSLLKGDLFYIVLSLVMLIMVAAELVIWFNRVNRKLALFFNAVKSSDNTLRFPEKSGLPSENQFNESLNRINETIGAIAHRLEVQKGLHQTIMEHIYTGILTIDHSGRIEFANQALLDMFGLPALHHIDQLKRYGTELVDMLLTMRVKQPSRIRISSGDHQLDVTIRVEEVVMHKASTRIVSIHNIGRELEKQELESWQKLIRQLNHEITNTLLPVTSISASLLENWSQREKNQTNEEPCELTGYTLRGLETIHERSQALTRFIDNYRSLTRLPAPRFSPTGVMDLFTRIAMLARGYESKEGTPFPEIKIEVKPENMVINVDEDLMGQVILNLVKNAIESFSGFEESPMVIMRAVKESGGTPVLEVIDNGQGIDNQTLSMIFVPFFTTKINGSGIGLSISRQILEMHNASLGVNTKPGQGSTFRIRL